MSTDANKKNDPTKDENNNATTATVGADSTTITDKKPVMEAMEEDDEFEEFDNEHWGKNEIEETTQQWMENWDDDMDDNFTKHLREELQKNSTTTTT